MRVDHQQAETFRDTLAQVAYKVCPKYGIDPAECIRASAEATCFGKHAIHNNYFNLEGNGDRGHNIYIRSARTLSSLNGGMEPRTIKLGRFSTPEASVHEWCRRQRR